MHFGIDYGSKLAGTTAVCYDLGDSLHFAQSEKKKDADRFVAEHIRRLMPEFICIDAPLSLPAVFSGTGAGDDYFYRLCDRELGAMSPMFLGGLTARAMQLRAGFPEMLFYEIYPAHLTRVLFPENSFYKKDLTAFCRACRAHFPLVFERMPENWHQVDAGLAWLTGWRLRNGKADTFGREGEGVIIV